MRTYRVTCVDSPEFDPSLVMVTGLSDSGEVITTVGHPDDDVRVGDTRTLEPPPEWRYSAGRLVARKSLEFLDATSTLATLCRATGRWGLYISSTGSDEIEEGISAAPYLAEEGFHSRSQILRDGHGFVLGSEEEILALFHRTVGKDGPTNTNPYNGEGRWYALVCDDHGRHRTENT